ncbi:hypothetical protein L2E82_50751 [Cichorium intybus]|nr:hypothetical protein L2E82_50751 [Cichorium intybus]
MPLSQGPSNDSILDDALERKITYLKFSSRYIGDVSKKLDVLMVKEDESDNVMVEDASATKNAEIHSSAYDVPNLKFRELNFKANLASYGS